jgi:hypothetical protein
LNLERTEPEHIGASEEEQYKGRNNIQEEEQYTRRETIYKGKNKLQEEEQYTRRSDSNDGARTERE